MGMLRPPVEGKRRTPLATMDVPGSCRHRPGSGRLWSGRGQQGDLQDLGLSPGPVSWQCSCPQGSMEGEGEKLAAQGNQVAPGREGSLGDSAGPLCQLQPLPAP